MVFVPAIPFSGVAGFNFLQATYDRQLDTFSNSPQIRNDVEYAQGRLAEPISVDDFISDRRLLRVTLTAFGLAGEETKGGFVRRVFESASDPDDNFLQRINNPDYVRFSEAIGERDGQISLSADAVTEILQNFEIQSFEAAVGNVDVDQRISLNYQSDISELVTDGASDEAVLFRLLGNVPVRELLETALGLPESIRQLDIDQQADILDTRLRSTLGISDLQELAEPENVDRVIQRFLAIQGINNGPSPFTPGAVALTLLTGVGSSGSQNLFLSRFI
ncbi:MAG: DUF1217 domain-containing protein [Pseudomonadota bacterium]